MPIVDLFRLVSACLHWVAGGIGSFWVFRWCAMVSLRYDVQGIGVRGQAMLDNACIAVSIRIVATLILGAWFATATYLTE